MMLRKTGAGDRSVWLCHVRRDWICMTHSSGLIEYEFDTCHLPYIGSTTACWADRCEDLTKTWNSRRKLADQRSILAVLLMRHASF
jgi:hypothetical protein